MKNFTKSQAGFTLIEVMVVIAITLTLSSILLFYNRSNERQIVLFKERAVMLGTLNQAKALAIQKFLDAESRSCAFGVHFWYDANGSQQFVLFQDMKPGAPLQINILCRDAVTGDFLNDFIYSAAEGETLNTVTLDQNYEFRVYDSGEAQILDDVDVLFIPPDPQATSTGYFLPIRVEIRPRGSGAVTREQITSIFISTAGQITTDNY